LNQCWCSWPVLSSYRGSGSYLVSRTSGSGSGSGSSSGPQSLILFYSKFPVESSAHK
jgi:hypothetical protein